MSLSILAAAVAAPTIYVSEVFGLSFSPPPEAYVCTHPRFEASGERHGPFFLEKPTHCGEGRPPSANRTADPPSRVEVLYGLVSAEGRAVTTSSCPGGAVLREAWILGVVRAVCRRERPTEIVYQMDVVIDHHRPRLAVSIRLRSPREPTEDEFMDMLYVVASLKIVKGRPQPADVRF